MAAWVAFLRRELAPTPGRGGATLRLTLACLVATVPILTHRIPFGLVVMIVMYLITQEDTAATLLGSILAVVGVTISLGLALCVWMIVLDIAWLRICAIAVFLFGGLFLKRVLRIGALGSALGLPGALVMILPDVLTVPSVSSPSPEVLTELVLWLWLSVTLGLGVNLGVQLLLAPGDPLTLLQREVDTRLRVVTETVRGLAGGAVPAVPSVSLDSLVTSGMTRPLALLRNASLTRRWASERHEVLAAIITLVDRLVTDAAALPRFAAAAPPDPGTRAALLRVGDGCEAVREAFGKRQRPVRRDVTAPSDLAAATIAWPPLADMTRTLEQLALTLQPRESTERRQEPRPGLLLPDALTNPEHVQFAIRGMTACLICYIVFIGLDYPGIYTSVITCFVVALSTIGSSNQKGALRFAGAALGGLMGLLALVYAFPNVDGIGGFWLVFAAGTAVAAWINFGTPRVSYGGYQTGLAFYKAVFQGFGPAVSATVLRDRLIGVAFGLIVFGLLERVLWPVRATDRMRERLADVLRALAALARNCTEPGGLRSREVDSRRRLISEQVSDIQGLIESSKFESDTGSTLAIQQLTGDAQTVLVVLLAILRREEMATPMTQVAVTRLLAEVAAVLEARAEHPLRGDRSPRIDLDEALASVECEGAAAGPQEGRSGGARVVLYRELVLAVNRLAHGDSKALETGAR